MVDSKTPFPSRKELYGVKHTVLHEQRSPLIILHVTRRTSIDRDYIHKYRDREFEVEPRPPPS